MRAVLVAPTRNLTQPTELAADWAGIDYTSLSFLRPGGIHIRAFSFGKPGSLRERPKGENMLTQTQLVPAEAIELARIPRKQVVEMLKNFRKEWQKTADEQSLLDVYAPVALFIVDMIHGLDLSRSDAMDILGFDLWAECSNEVGEIGRA